VKTEWDEVLTCGFIEAVSLPLSLKWNTVRQQSTEHLDENFWVRAVGGTILGISIGSFNRDLIAEFLSNNTLGLLIGFGIGGLISGAIQGALLRRYIHLRWLWLTVSSMAWIVLGSPEIWLPPDTLSYWACNHIMRWALVGLFNGTVAGMMQFCLLWRFRPMAWWWIIMQALVWASLLVVPILLFESLLRGEGSCYY